MSGLVPAGEWGVGFDNGVVTMDPDGDIEMARH
jgi:hypothetical protein